jgi:hypothetical protein
MILGYRYQSSAVIDAKQADREFEPVASVLQLDAAPGTRAPHVWLEQRGRRISTLDLCGTHFVLLSGMQGDAWIAAARTVSAYPLVAYRIVPDGAGVGDLHDPDRSWALTYKIALDEAILIRPDGFVAWRSDLPDDDVTGVDECSRLNHAFRRILGHQEEG